MAPFIGHFYDGKALNLVHKLEGELTLAKALQGGFPWNVEEAIMGRTDDQSPERRAAIIRKIARQVFQNLAGIHNWNVVHRDVKGANLVLAEKAGRFKLIDFGAACDLVSRTNYDAKLSVFDPSYGPPEAPPDEGGLVVSAGGKFDVFSAGLLVMQMCFPAYKSDDGIKRFKRLLEAADWDLGAWRESVEGANGFREGLDLLDQYGGFKLLQGCFQRNPSSRPSAAAAASSGFCRV